MRLESIHIKQFRSLEKVSLEDIGELNVLIGKNNSGKSNILFAIDSFFACIRGGNLVVAEPPIGTDLDFFGRRTQTPIQIDVCFSMSSDDRNDLVKDIVNDAPQMKNAADGINEALWIAVSLQVSKYPRRAAFISGITLTRAGKLAEKPVNTLLSVSNDAAIELISKSVGSSRAARQASSLEQLTHGIDPDDWRRIKDRAKEGEPILRMLWRRPQDLDREAYDKLESVLRQSDSYADFQRFVSSLATATKQEAEKTLNELLRNTIGTFAGEETGVPKYVHNLLRRIAGLKVLYLKERRSPIGEEEAKRLLSYKVQRGGTQILQNIQDTVSALLGVRIDAFNSTSAGKEAEMDVDDFLADVNGSGIREALRIVLDFEFQKPDIFLVEEPEIYLHPSLETSMMRYLKTVSLDAQVFITTHSTNFLDTAEMKNVYLVSKEKATQVQKLNFEEAEMRLPHELGIRLSSLFLFDRLVFVEGPSDEAVLREWAAKLQVNFSQAGVGFVHMGGVHNFGYFATEQTMSFLMKRKVKLWFLIDRDEKEESEIAKLAKQCGPNALLKVLKKRELENYLAIPRVVAEFIAVKKRLANPSMTIDVISEAEIAKKIDEVAENLKPLAVEKRVVKSVSRPVYPAPRKLFEGGAAVGPKRIAEEIGKSIAELEESRAVLEKVYVQQEKVVDKAWSVDKLSVVPGDFLLDGVCQLYGVRFRKEIDSSRAAALLRQSEIDHEIELILREIGGTTP